MSNQESMPINPVQPGKIPDWLVNLNLQEEAQTQFMASKIAGVLADPQKSYLLETLYEGSSFTPSIGQEVDFNSGEDDLSPVRDGIDILRKEGALETKSSWIDVVELIEDADGKTIERVTGKSLVQVIFHADKATEFLD